MPDDGQPDSSKSGAAASKSAPTPAPVAAEVAPAESAQAESKPSTPSTPARQFDVSSLAARLRPAAPSELIDAPPTVNGSAAPTSMTIPGLNLNTSAAGPAPAAPAATPVNAPPAAAKKQAPTTMGGRIVQASLVTRKEPEYPKLARQMGVRGVVELTATIGQDGRVKSVKVDKGHPLLQKAATDAVMQWVYKPTMLNGVAVQSDTKISLNFLGDR
jgi:protein TonB